MALAVGNDQRAQQFLGELDTHPVVGGLVDCISPYEAEQEEMMRKSGFNLTPDLYIMKLLMGGIDTSYVSRPFLLWSFFSCRSRS